MDISYIRFLMETVTYMLFHPRSAYSPHSPANPPAPLETRHKPVWPEYYIYTLYPAIDLKMESSKQSSGFLELSVSRSLQILVIILNRIMVCSCCGIWQIQYNITILYKYLLPSKTVLANLLLGCLSSLMAVKALWQDVPYFFTIYRWHGMYFSATTMLYTL